MAQTAKVIPIRSVNALITQTRAAWNRADEKKADADDWYIRTGKLLIELKERTPHGQWISTLKKLGRSQQRASELMALADGTTTITEQRERVRKAVKKTRAKSPLRNGDLSEQKSKSKTEPDLDSDPDPEVDEEEIEEQGDTPEDQWNWSLANLAGDILAIQSYWGKHFPQWETYPIPSHIKVSVKEAATVFASLAKAIAKRR